MDKPLKDVVSARLTDLGRNPFEAARIGGLERSYVNDILIGKKTSIRGDKVAQLARALDMRPSELIAQDPPDDAGYRQPARAPLPNLRTAREERGLSLESLAHEVGISTSQLSRIETGEREARVGEVKSLAAHLKMSVSELLRDDREAQTPVVGLVSAGSDAVAFSAGQGPFDYVDPPEGSSENTVAVEVRGKSLGEIFDGWLVFYDDVRNPPTPQMMNRLCVAELDDGRVVVKRITKGQRRDRFNLSSNVEPPIYDAKVAWAARVIAMKPRT